MQLVSWKNRNLGLDPTEVHLNTYKNLGLDPTKVHLNTYKFKFFYTDYYFDELFLYLGSLQQGDVIFKFCISSASCNSDLVLCLDRVLWKCEQAEMQLVSWKNRNLGLDPDKTASIPYF
jgi:hypothetical protein